MARPEQALQIELVNTLRAVAPPLMSDPFRIEGPALISFSGGRTSAYMLRRIIDAWDGELPADVIVAFSNTSKEREETLVFIAECARRWNVGIIWLERGPDGVMREVSFGTAARNGEVFKALIDKKGYLPNPVTRFCTSELKIRVMRDYARSLGWRNWTNVLGLRADEPARVARVARASTNRDPWDNAMPLAKAGISEGDVLAYWKAQSFDLQLTPGEGNCDLCFLKSAATISAIIERRPDLAIWWAEAEALARASKPSGARFRQDRPSYAQLADAVARQDRFDFGERDRLHDCFCTE